MRGLQGAFRQPSHSDSAVWCLLCLPRMYVMREKDGVPNCDQIKYLGAGFHLSDWSSVDLVK